MTLYHLTFRDPETSCDGYDETFFIGVFRTAGEAEQTARRYLSSVPGFKDHPCAYSIVEKPVHGEIAQGQSVYWIEGWNWNEDRDEVDVLQSEEDYAREADARAALTAMKKAYVRTEWIVARAVPGLCDWQDGFERYPYEAANHSS